MPLVLLDIADGVATITLNNPDERNTMTAPMVSEIVAAMDRIEADENIGAIVVTGTAPAFCAGANLGNLAEADGESLGVIYEGFLRIARSPLPTIAAVNGAAVGAGMNLALGCDVRIAARRAKFDTRFLQLGIHPGGGHTWMLRRIVGPQAAMAAVLFGEILDGAEAERVGLAYKCVDDDKLLETAHALGARAASAPRELVIETKKTIAAMANVVQDLLAPKVWHIGFFIVESTRQGNGDAQAIFQGLETWAQSHGAHWLRLGVVLGNTRAESFWKSMGFIETTQRLGVEMGQRINTIRVMFKPLCGGTVDQYLALVERDRPPKKDTNC